MAAAQLWAMMKTGTKTAGVRGGRHDLGSSLSAGPRLESEPRPPRYPEALSGSWAQSTGAAVPPGSTGTPLRA